MNLLTYCGQKNPIIGFRLDLQLLSILLQLPPPVGHTKRSQGSFNLAFPTRTRSSHLPMIANHRMKHSSRRSVFIHPNDMAKPAKPLDINTLSNVHVIEKLIQLPVSSDTVVIANSYWKKKPSLHFSFEHSQGSCICAWQRQCLSAIKKHG